MNHQLGVITAKIDDLPSALAKHISNIGTTPTTLPAAPATPDAPADPHPFRSGPKFMVLPQLQPEDYPDVKHWTPREYNAKQKKVKSEEEGGEPLDPNAPAPGTSKKSRKRSGSDGEASILSSFMENEKGEQLPESTKSAARSKAKEFWLKLFKRGIAPSCHSDADIDIRDEYLAIMENAFPWLRYCDNHWKAHQIWRSYYPDWIVIQRGLVKEKAEKEKAEKEKAAKEKAAPEGEVIDVDADVDNSQDNQGGSSKRPRVDDETSSEPKRRRVEEDPLEQDQATLPSRPRPTKITPKRSRVCFILYITWPDVSLTVFRRTYCTKILGICASG